MLEGLDDFSVFHTDTFFFNFFFGKDKPTESTQPKDPWNHHHHHDPTPVVVNGLGGTVGSFVG